MKTARLIFVFGLFFRLTAGTALADELPTFQILMKDGRLIPATLEVPANTKFRLEVRNENPGAAEFESYDLKKELVLAPGAVLLRGFALPHASALLADAATVQA